MSVVSCHVFVNYEEKKSARYHLLLFSTSKRHTLYSRPGPSEKPDPGPLQKPDPIPKFTVRVKDSIYDKWQIYDKLITNLRVLISNMAIVFWNSSPKIQKQGIFSIKFRDLHSQIKACSLFHEISQLDKFEGADFKYDNIAFKFRPKNTQIRHFWSQI